MLSPPSRQISAFSAKILSHHEVHFHAVHFVFPQKLRATVKAIRLHRGQNTKSAAAEGWRSDPFFHDKPTEEESLLFVGHVGVLLTAEDGTLHFVEKVAFQEPYRMLRFAYRTALSDYLMGKYDTSWGQDMASPFIMENDEFMDGWRPNPDRRRSAIG